MTNTITIRGSYGTLTVHRLGGIVLGGTHEVEREIAPGHWSCIPTPEVSEEYSDIRWVDPQTLEAGDEMDILNCAFVCAAGHYYPQLQPVFDPEWGFNRYEKLRSLPPP